MTASISVFFPVYVAGAILTCIGVREANAWLVPIGLAMWILGALLLPYIWYRRPETKDD